MRSEPGRRTLSEGDRRVLAAWAAACAERVLRIFETAAPGDERPREAIDGLRAFARGEARISALRSVSVAAHAAARSVADPAAVAAARSAGHAAATAHMAAHARGAAAYAALAASLAEPDTESAASETSWQLAHAPEAVRDVLRRLPEPLAGGGVLGNLIRELSAAV